MLVELVLYEFVMCQMIWSSWAHVVCEEQMHSGYVIMYMQYANSQIYFLLYSL